MHSLWTQKTSKTQKYIYTIRFEWCILWTFGAGVLELEQVILYVPCNEYVHGPFFIITVQD